MSRIGQIPIPIPSSVKVAFNESEVQIEGSQRHIELDYPTRN